MEKKIILAIKKHRILDYIIGAYIVEENESGFYKIIDTLTEKNIPTDEETYKIVQKIVKIIDKYSEQTINKLFNKNKKLKPHDYIYNLQEEEIEKRIRPYIENRLADIINLLLKYDIELYQKKDEYATIYPEDRIIIHKDKAQTVFNFIKTKEESRYFLTVKHNNKEMNLNGQSAYILTNKPCILILNNNLYIFDDIDGKKLLPFFEKEYVRIPKQIEQKYFGSFVKNSIINFPVKTEGFEIREIIPEKKAIARLEKDWKYELALFVYFQYDNIEYHASKKNIPKVDFQIKGDDFVFYKLTRDTNWENNLLKKIESSGLKQESKGIFKLPKTKNDTDIIKWLNNNKKKLEEAGFILQQKLYNIEYFIEKISLDFEYSKRNDWFDIRAYVYFGDYKIPFIKLKKHILQKNPNYKLPNGQIAVIPEEWFTRYNYILAFAEEKNDDTLSLKEFHFQLVETIDFKSHDKSYEKKLKDFFRQNNDDITRPKNLQATLRKYQLEGFKWLVSLHKNKFGGILADDMGLGKTLQTISLLLYVYEETIYEKQKIKGKQLSLFENSTTNRDNKPPSLIIMPKSLIHNWKNEFKKFSPTLKVMTYIGFDRQKNISNFDKYNVILSSYGVVRNDISMLEDIDFQYIILDESQYVKNPESKTYQAISKLNAQNYLALTGTPIENSLKDLWAQMDFVNSGLLGNLNFFKEFFIKAIEKYNDEDQTEKLLKLIRPFILRRTKSEVEKDLPPVVEQTIYCEMSEKQSQIYDKEKSAYRNAIIELMENGKLKKSPFIVLKGLTMLRQIANHPLMTNENYNGDSGKYEIITTYMENLFAENHKVLIFSSFVKHLKIIENYLKTNSYEYSILTGQTKNREQVIKEFTENKSKKAFLISIKAGGVGLNLTVADYVFILDPWWNPAVENQAISRAHRIGQNKKVMVYRFITKNTVEEKIRIIQEKKINLSQSVIQTTNPLNSMSDNEIMELFG